MKMRRWMGLFSAIMIMALLLPYHGGVAAPVVAPRASSITGRVVDKNGTGVADVTVRAHSGPALVVSPSSLPADGETTASVTVLGITPGHNLRLISSRSSLDVFGSSTGAADTHGTFSTTLKSSKTGSAQITVTDLTTGEDLDASDSVVFTGGDNPEVSPDAPIITAVKAKLPLDGRYFEGLDAENTIQLSIDWKGHPAAHVEYAINGTKTIVVVNPGIVEITLQMDKILKAGVNVLEFTAVSGDDLRSATKSFVPRFMAQPEWLSGLQAANMLAKLFFKSAEATSDFDIPKDPIKFRGGTVEFQINVSGGATVSLQCEQAGKFNVSASAGLAAKLKSITVGGSLALSGEVTAGVVNCWIPSADGTVQLTLTLFGQKDWPLPVFVAEFINPAVAGTLDALTGELVGDASLRIFGTIYARAEISGSIGSGVTFIAQSPHVEWKQLTVGLGLKPEAGYHFSAFEIELKAYLALSGNISQTIPTIIDFALNKWSQYSVTGEAGFEFEVPVIDCAYKRVYSVTWNYDQSSSPPDSVSVSQVENKDCNPSDPRQAPAAFAAGATSMQAFDRVWPADWRVSSDAPIRFEDAQTAASVLVSNAYERAEPDLAVKPGDTQAMLVWVYNEPAKPVGQSKEIYFSHWNGSAWSTPAAITQDLYLDSTPRVVWNSAGEAVALWLRLPEVQSSLAWDETIAGKIEIATATYNPATNTWSAPSQLTTNTALDLGARLARNPDGKLLAVWKQNAAGKLAGSAANPDVLMAAFYNTAWETPTSAAVDVPGASDLSVAYGTNAATLAYVQAVTPSGGGEAIPQIFTLTWNGSAWGAPQQQTFAAEASRAPRLVYNAANQAVLVWMSAAQIYTRNLSGGEAVQVAVPAEVGSVDELQIVQNAGGSIAAVFTAQTADRRDLYLSFYDQEHNLWGNPRKLTDDAGIEKYPAPALDESGRLLVGYTSALLTYETHSLAAGDGVKMTAVKIPVDGRTDLMTLSHTFNRNLTLGNRDLSLSNPNPLPGDTVTLTAQVHNSGDLAVDGVRVSFYDGNPASGGLLIGSVTRSEPLAAGFGADLSLDIPFVSEDGQRTYYAVVDESGTITESDETDNITSLVAFTPDLAVVSPVVEYWGGREVGLRATIQNVGVSPAPASVVTFYRVSQPTTPLTTLAVPALEPGQSIVLTAPWQTTGLDAGSYDLRAVLTLTGLSEVALDNNTRDFTLFIRPDVMVNAYDLWVTDWKANPRQVNAWVYNTGPVDATNVVVTLYNRPTITAAAQVGTQTIASLPANSAVQISFSVSQEVPCGLYLLANSDSSLAESSFENNLASVANPYEVCPSGTTGCSPVSGGRLNSQGDCETMKVAYLPLVTFPSVGLTAPKKQRTVVAGRLRAVTEEDYTTTTDANGYYTFDNLPDGVYQITPTKNTYRFTPFRRVITLPASGALELDFVAEIRDFNPDEMVVVPGGSFEMGCSPAHNGIVACEYEWPTNGELPLHSVTLDTYRIDKYEVTNARYEQCVTAGACTPPHDAASYTRPAYYGTSMYANYPVVMVNWTQAATFCAWEGKRLPTEAEWEKAARGSSPRAFPWGDEMPDCSLANAGDYKLATYCVVNDTMPVGSHPGGGSPYKAMDMGGNVWEWVNDWYDVGYYGSQTTWVNPTGPATGSYRVFRGGYWNAGHVYARTSFRGTGNEDTGYSRDVGFRCALSGGQ